MNRNIDLILVHLGLIRYNLSHMNDVNSPSFWEESYRSGRTGWDLGADTGLPADLAESGSSSLEKCL